MSVRDAFNLAGRTALVTGGSRGLGLAMAGALGEMGAKVVISARKVDELDTAVASLKARGVDAVRVVGDLSRAENVSPFVDAVAAKADTAAHQPGGAQRREAGRRQACRVRARPFRRGGAREALGQTRALGRRRGGRW